VHRRLIPRTRICSEGHHPNRCILTGRMSNGIPTVGNYCSYRSFQHFLGAFSSASAAHQHMNVSDPVHLKKYQTNRENQLLSHYNPPPPILIQHPGTEFRMKHNWNGLFSKEGQERKISVWPPSIFAGQGFFGTRDFMLCLAFGKIHRGCSICN
jgi:hypothetical protein